MYMYKLFITKIHVEKVRHLENLEITLSDKRKHLILTGKNGSGKTSLLNALNEWIRHRQTNVMRSSHEEMQINVKMATKDMGLISRVEHLNYDILSLHIFLPGVVHLHSLYL